MLHAGPWLIHAPRHELRSKEVAVAVVDERGGSAVFELEECRVVAGAGTRREPVTDRATDGAHHATTEQADSVNLVWALPVHEPATTGEVHLLRHPRTQHPVGVRPDVDGAKVAELARVDHAAH